MFDREDKPNGAVGHVFAIACLDKLHFGDESIKTERSGVFISSKGKPLEGGDRRRRWLAEVHLVVLICD